MKNIISILLLGFGLVLNGYSQASFQHLNLNQQVYDVNGNKGLLRDLIDTDKPVVLDFWATWCKPCLLKYEAINEEYLNWQKATDIQIIAVSIDKRDMLEKVKNIAKESGWTFTVILDPDKELFGLYNEGSTSVPKSFFFDKRGVLKGEKRGADMSMKKSEKEINTSTDDPYDSKNISVDLSGYYKKILEISI